LRALKEENRRLIQAARGIDAGRVDVERSAGKKLTRPVERYAVVKKLIADHGLS